MCRKITVSESEPDWHSVRFNLFKTPEALVTQAPSAHGIQLSGQAIGDGIDVRADMQTPDIGIVTDIHNDMDIFLRHSLHKAAQEFCGAGSACKDSIVGCSHPNILRGTQARGPEVKEDVRNYMLEVVDFTVRCFSIEETKHSTCGRLDV